MDKNERGETRPQMRGHISKAGERYIFWHINGFILYCEGEAAEVAIALNPWCEQIGLGMISTALSEKGIWVCLEFMHVQKTVRKKSCFT